MHVDTTIFEASEMHRETSVPLSETKRVFSFHPRFRFLFFVTIIRQKNTHLFSLCNKIHFPYTQRYTTQSIITLFNNDIHRNNFYYAVSVGRSCSADQPPRSPLFAR